MDTGNSKLSLLHSRILDLQEEGCAIDIAHVDPGTKSEIDWRYYLVCVW